MKHSINERLYLDSNRYNWLVRGLSEKREVELDDQGNPIEGTDALGCYKHLGNLIAALRAGKLYGPVAEKDLREIAYFGGRLADAQKNIRAAFATPLRHDELRCMKIALELPGRFRFHCNDPYSWCRQEPDRRKDRRPWKSKSYFPTLAEALASTHVILVRGSKAKEETCYQAIGECEDEILALHTQLPAAFFAGVEERPQTTL